LITDDFKLKGTRGVTGAAAQEKPEEEEEDEESKTYSNIIHGPSAICRGHDSLKAHRPACA